MNPCSEDVKDMLESESALGLIFKTNLFIGKEPAVPRDCVTIFDTYSRPPQLTMAGKGEVYYYPSIQIRIRNSKYVAGWSLIESIAESLHGRAHETWNDTLYTVIAIANGPMLLDWDDNGLVRFIINFNLQRR